MVEWDRLALVPVTVTWNVPVEVKLHDNVELPVPVTLDGVRMQAVLLPVRVTTWLKPWRDVMVIVEFPDLPTVAMTVVALAEIVKSWTASLTAVDLVRPPLLPITVTE